MTDLKLPDWAILAPDGRIEVAPGVVYPLYLEKLQVEPAELTQVWLEIARRCFTADLFDILWQQGFDVFSLRILTDDGWRLDRYPSPPPKTGDTPEDLERERDRIVHSTWRREYKRIPPPCGIAAMIDRFSELWNAHEAIRDDVIAAHMVRPDMVDACPDEAERRAICENIWRNAGPKLPKHPAYRGACQAFSQE